MNYWRWDDVTPNLSATGGPVDQTVSFQPDIGVPITRRRTTGRVESWNIPVTFWSRDTFAEFEEWFHADLKSGVLPFVWRHPSSGAVRKFRLIPASYQSSYPGGEWVQVSLTAMILPGMVWFAPYVPDGSSRVPDFVADYQANRYWIGQSEVAAAALSGISGDYTTLTQQLTYTQTMARRVFTGDVPQVAPLNTDFIAGFLNAT